MQPCVYFDDCFLEPEFAERYYNELLQTIQWETSAKINRWVYLCQDRGIDDATATYQYRDAPTAKPLGEEDAPDFTELVRSIASRAHQWYQRHVRSAVENNTEDATSCHFNVCLLNYYENGLQRIGWHADREEMGRTTPVLSISLGATRSFYLRAKVDGGHDRATLPLTSGSILCLAPPCQERYVHAIPKEPLVTEGRINLTFRCKQNDTTHGERIHERRNNWLPSMLAEELPDDGEGAEQGATTPNGAGSYAETLSATSGWSLWSTASVAQHPNDIPSTEDAAVWHSTKVFGDDVASGQDVSDIQYMIKTNLGAECYCAAEIQECLSSPKNDACWIMARPCGIDGYVAVCAPSTTEALEATNVVVAKLLQLRSAHHVMQYHTHFDLSDCCRPEEAKVDGTARVDGEAIYRHCKDCLVAGTMSISTMASFTADQTGSFRVTCERIGTSHAFRGPEIER
jgi:alkylated DNA repair dioxygenase AlkB